MLTTQGTPDSLGTVQKDTAQNGWSNLCSITLLFGVFPKTFSLFQKTEEWEKEKSEADMVEFVWENSASERNALDTLLQIRAAEKMQEVSRQEVLDSDVVLGYKKSVVALRNEGETEKNMAEYKNSVKRLLNLDAL